MFRCVIFDLDGVLVDSYECWRNLINEGLALQGRPPASREEFHSGWGQGIDADREQFFSDWTIDQVIDFYNKHFAEYARFVKSENGALAVLQRLKADGFLLAVGSNSPEEVVRLLLQETKALEFLDCYAGADQVERAKPAPDLILHILSHLNLEPEQACYVGDSSFDEWSAAAAGVFFVGYKRAGQRRIDHLEEILALVTT
jgi:HAD superfamily hydrolase (TIGR01509 family)